MPNYEIVAPLPDTDTTRLGECDECGAVVRVKEAERRRAGAPIYWTSTLHEGFHDTLAYGPRDES